MGKIGSFSLALYSHVPYIITQSKWPHKIDWLNELVAETYMPLLNVIHRLVEEEMSPKITIGFTPVLLDMLDSDTFRDGFKEYLEERYSQAEDDMVGFEKASHKQQAMVARMWREFYTILLREFSDRYDEDILASFAELQDLGHIEVITGTATNCYLPLLSKAVSVRAQIMQAIQTYERHFGRKPKGILLPSGSPLWVKGFLSKNGIEYMIANSNPSGFGVSPGEYINRFKAFSMLWGNERERPAPEAGDSKAYPCGIHYLATSKLASEPELMNDPLMDLQSLNAKGGYIADVDCLDVSRKNPQSGLRYWRVSDTKADLADREVYYPDVAFTKIAEHGVEFQKLITETLDSKFKKDGTQRAIVGLYDARLLGQWWFEGAEWLYHVVESFYIDGNVELATIGDCYLHDPQRPVIEMSDKSYTEKDDHLLFLNESTAWIWKRIHEAEEDMVRLIDDLGHSKDAKLLKVLRQTARELLLLQSSDWQQLVSSLSLKEYAEMQVVKYYENFKRLVDISRHVRKKGSFLKKDVDFLAVCQERDNIFIDIDPLWFKDGGS